MKASDFMRRVLIVDDEPIIRNGLKDLISWEEFGFFICGEAGDGEEGLAKALELLPDLMVVDVKMPEMGGLELIEALINRGFQCDFIILSGYSEFGYAQKSLELGVSAYLLKPVEEEELIFKLKKIAEKAEKRIREGKIRQPFSDREALQRMHFSFFLQPYDPIRTPGDVPGFLSMSSPGGGRTAMPSHTEMEQAARELHLAVCSRRMKGVDAVLANLRERFRQAGETPEIVKARYMSLVVMTRDYIRHDARFSSCKVIVDASFNEEILTQINSKRSLTSLNDYVREIFGQWSQQLGPIASEDVVATISDYVEGNFAKKITLETLARVFNYHSAYLGKLFRDTTGRKFHDFLDEVRVRKAKELLEKGLNVQQASERVGYSDPDYFYLKFKKIIGIPVAEFRRRHVRAGAEDMLNSEGKTD